MNNTNYIAYYRVSTEEQGLEGLGIAAQKTSVNTFLSNFGGEITKEIQEVVSGGADIRDGLEQAVNLCKDTGSTLLVSKIDRLSRDGFKTLYLLEKNKVKFVEAQSPNDSELSQNIKFLVAKDEKKRIQGRVEDALSEIKTNIKKNGYHISKKGNRITSLGKPGNLSQQGRDKSIVTRKTKALNNINNKRAFAAVGLMKDRSLRQIASFLNDNGFYTSTGKTFYPMQVSNLIKLYA